MEKGREGGRHQQVVQNSEKERSRKEGCQEEVRCRLSLSMFRSQVGGMDELVEASRGRERGPKTLNTQNINSRTIFSPLEQLSNLPCMTSSHLSSSPGRSWCRWPGRPPRTAGRQGTGATRSECSRIRVSLRVRAPAQRRAVLAIPAAGPPGHKAEVPRLLPAVAPLRQQSCEGWPRARMLGLGSDPEPLLC